MSTPAPDNMVFRKTNQYVAAFSNMAGMRFAELLPILVLAAVPPSVGQASRSRKYPTQHVPAAQACGPAIDGLLKCPRFGFTYKTTFGWVDRTDDMNPDTDVAKAGDDNAKNPLASGSDKPATLLAVLERPPGAPGDTINSAVVIVAESLADYHGIKSAADYFGPITELAEQRGFKVEAEPHMVAIGTKQLVRGDFSKERGKVTMWQSSVVMIDKGYIVSFTFVGGSEDEVDELIGNLSFGAPLPRKNAPPA